MARDVVRQSGIALAIGCAAGGACGAQPTTPGQQALATDRGVTAWQRGTVHVSGAPALDPAVAAQLAPFAAVASSKLLDISDDGTQLLVLQGGDAMLVTAPLAAPVARTADIDISWARFGEHGTIEYAGDRDGTERDRLFQTSAGGGAASGGNKRLLAEDHGRVADPIERNGRLIWAEPTETDTTIWLLDGGKPHKIYTDEGAWAVIDLSSDGTQMLARHTVSLESSTLYRVDISDGHAIALTSVDPRVATPSGAFGVHGQLFAVSSAGDRNNAWELLPHGARLLAPELAWDVTQLAVAPDGTTVAFTVNVDGASVLYLYDTATHAHQVAPDSPDGGVISELRFAAKAPVLAFSFSDARQPRQAFTYDLRERRTRQWTRSDLGTIDEGKLALPEHVRIPSAGIHVPALVMKPHRKAPVVIDLHGGPEDQWTAKWAPFEQFLVSRGIAVVQPNVRGSVGYGREYAALDDGMRRDDAVKDVGAVLDWIATQPDLDASRVAVMGTSYGGYLALAALIAYPDRLHAGVDLWGIADFVAFLEGTAPYRRASRRVEYGDERDPAVRAHLAAISPLAHAAAIKVPLLVAVGRKDPRVPPAVSDGLVTAVRGAGGSVWYVAADDEGHGFTKPDSTAVLQALIAQLLAR